MWVSHQSSRLQTARGEFPSSGVGFAPTGAARPHDWGETHTRGPATPANGRSLPHPAQLTFVAPVARQASRRARPAASRGRPAPRPCRRSRRRRASPRQRSAAARPGRRRRTTRRRPWVARVRAQLCGAGLAGDLHAGEGGGGPGAGADDVDHHRAHLAGDPRRYRPPADDAVERGDPRPRAAAAGGDRRADARHRQRRGEVAVLPDRGGADGEAVLELGGGRDRARLRRRDPRPLVEPERARGGDEPARADLRRRAERRPSCTSARTNVCSVPPQASPPALRSCDSRQRRGGADRIRRRRRRDPVLRAPRRS